MSNSICYACFRPVSYFASRCPHCTSALSINGMAPGQLSWNSNEPKSFWYKLQWCEGPLAKTIWLGTLVWYLTWYFFFR